MSGEAAPVPWHRGFPWRESLPLLALFLVAALSCLLLWATNTFWRDTFHAYLPALTSLRQAKADLLKGYLVSQKVLAGEIGVRPEDPAAYFDQARSHARDVAEFAAELDESMDRGENAPSLAGQIREYARRIGEFAELAERRSSAQSAEREALSVDQRSLYSQLDRLGRELDLALERRFDDLATRQDRITVLLLVLWLGFLALLATALTITVSRQRAAAAALRASEIRYRTLAERSQDGVLILEGKPPVVAYVNTALGRLTGYGDTEISSLTFDVLLDLVHPEDQGQVRRHREERLTGQASNTRQSFRILRKDGEVRWVDVSSSHVDLEGLALDQSIFRDITGEVLLRHDLVRARDRADAANQAKSEFLATMSHEIRTPLNGVMSMIELVEAEDLAPRQREYLRIARDSARKLLTILNDILDLSRIESGRVELIRESFNPRSMIHDLCALFLQQARMKGLYLDCSVSPELPSQLIGDSGRLRQILFNVVGNAVKFTEKGGVSLNVDYLPAGPDREAALLFSVEDDGIGIPQDKLDAIFQPFTQANGALDRKYGGTGLGLAIVRRLMSLMRGSLCIESRPGEGTFLHCLVRELKPGLGAVSLLRDGARAEAGPAHAHGSLRVLVAEDDKVNQLAIRLFLERLGHIPSCAANGKEALDLFGAQPFDCVLMDINMPIMDGVEATRRIRAAGRQGPTAPDVPVIAITAYAGNSDRERLLAAGLDGFVPKPAGMDDIAAALAAAMGGGKGA